MGAGYTQPELTLPRRTQTVSIPPAPADAKQPNRDAGKTFIVTEVDAVQAEEWGLRAMMALGTSGIVVPEDMMALGILAIPLVGYQAFMGAKEEAVLPLWREMLPACVATRHSELVTEPFARHHVEEVSTLLELRKTILELHTGFTMAELVSKFATMSSAFLQQSSSSTQGDV